MKELKPCPFCGEIPKTYQHIFHGYDRYKYKYKSDRYWIVECANPACLVVAHTYDKAKTEEEAIEMWNRRVIE